MTKQCKAITIKNKQCHKNAIDGHDYCKAHLFMENGLIYKNKPLYKRNTFWVTIGITLGVIGILSTIYYGNIAATKKEFSDLKAEILKNQHKQDEQLIGGPLDKQEILKISGKSCSEWGMDVCDLITSAEKELVKYNFIKAESIYQALILIDEKNAPFRLNYALTLYYNNNLKEAANQLRACIQLNDSFPDAHNNLGIILDDLGKFKDAENEYRKAIRLNPNVDGYHINLGITLKQFKRYDEAEIEYKKAINIKPGNSIA
jgi:tetratricopeptide (TPR) repeat protein